jgi:hypothetical protein
MEIPRTVTFWTEYANLYKAQMKMVTAGKMYCRLHFVLVSFDPFEARVYTNCCGM